MRFLTQHRNTVHITTFVTSQYPPMACKFLLYFSSVTKKKVIVWIVMLSACPLFNFWTSRTDLPSTDYEYNSTEGISTYFSHLLPSVAKTWLRCEIPELKWNHHCLPSSTEVIYGDRTWLGYAVAQLVEALRYTREGRGFDSRWDLWEFAFT